MKKCALLSSLPVLILVFTATGYSANVSHFPANGISASATACIDNCASEAVLTLLQYKSAGQNLYYAYFDIYGHDAQGNIVDINAVGLLPARMVSGDGHNRLTLKLDTEAAGMPVNYCVVEVSGNYSCSPYSGGVIDISWTVTRQFSTKATGQYSNTYANFTAHNTYRSEMSSATVQANIFGTQYSDAGSELGTGHEGGVTITKP
jgi:hypothetical protein